MTKRSALASARYLNRRKKGCDILLSLLGRNKVLLDELPVEEREDILAFWQEMSSIKPGSPRIYLDDHRKCDEEEARLLELNRMQGAGENTIFILTRKEETAPDNQIVSVVTRAQRVELSP